MRAHKFRPILFISLGILAAGLVLRETGVLDLSLYSSALQSSETTAISHSYQGEEKSPPFSYNLVLRQGEKVLGQHASNSSDHPPVELEAVLEPFQFTGDTWMPLWKRFTMSYVCNLTTVSSKEDHEFSGRAEGTVQADIRGFCSRARAKKLVTDELTAKLLAALQKQIEQ